jgi:hypothetical protein
LINFWTSNFSQCLKHEAKKILKIRENLKMCIQKN